MNANNQRTLLLSIFAAWCFIALRAQAEERPNQLLTTLRSMTISGEITATASMSGATLQPGLYEGWVINRVLNSQALRLSVSLFADGTGFCELDGLDPQTLSLVSNLRGNYTNAPGGGLAGKFVEHGGRFRGRVNEDRASAHVRLVVRSGGHFHARRFTLTRVSDFTPPTPATPIYHGAVIELARHIRNPGQNGGETPQIVPPTPLGRILSPGGGELLAPPLPPRP